MDSLRAKSDRRFRRFARSEKSGTGSLLPSESEPVPLFSLATRSLFAIAHLLVQKARSIPRRPEKL